MKLYPKGSQIDDKSHLSRYQQYSPKPPKTRFIFTGLKFIAIFVSTRKARFLLQFKSMNVFFRFILVSTLLFAGYIDSKAQSYSLTISAASFEIDGKSHSGYRTEFTQPYSEIKKEWWRYVKSITYLYNAKSHYILTIPAKGDSNTELQFISVLDKTSNKGAVLKVAPILEGLDEGQVTQFKKELKLLLVDFKIQYFTEMLQEKIEDKEKEIEKLSKELYKQKNDNSSNLDKLNQRLSKSNSELDALKEKLNQIK
ncbi:hypothetical protein [Reichenbachiella ulvae]|uniref:Uncharacterized protein n=1 Tax=Reichenbachiella ulvae TaxID=2980104 RepID=A0ABT3CVD8_9BACT|nr:hypothetical protein [Reichenbachiella ulvae]MCV9387584.1 hypothetical protein [Reichenbachiella ulvae]